MRTFEGIVVLVLGVPAIGLLGWWQVRSMRPDWGKINARRQSQGKPPIDPN